MSDDLISRQSVLDILNTEYAEYITDDEKRSDRAHHHAGDGLAFRIAMDSIFREVARRGRGGEQWLI